MAMSEEDKGGSGRDQNWKLTVPGEQIEPESGPRREDLGPFGDVVQVDELQRIEVAGAARDATKPVELRGRDVPSLVEVDLGDGVRWWTTRDHLLERVEASVEQSRGRSDGRFDSDRKTIQLPTTFFARAGSTRSATTLAFKSLRVLGVDTDLIQKVLGEATGRAAGRGLSALLESRLQPSEGLYRVRDVTALRPADKVESTSDLEGNKPLLVLLHGTASRTAGSFGDLAAGQGLRQLQDRVGEGRVLSLEHRTLSQSPVQNAIDLLELLPRNAELHLLSHSRGGLIGELLCRGHLVDGGAGFSAEEQGILSGRPDAALLGRLDHLLREKRPKVSRFVRVACPAAGTVLASGRVDLFLTVLINVLERIPGVGTRPLFPFLKALLYGLASLRTDPEDLPGLEAMRPESPLIALLNRAHSRLDADLTVVSGDIEGDNFLRRLALAGLDGFFGEDHDLVVHTQAMYGGAARRAGASRFAFDSTWNSHHFSYFETRRTAIVNALTAPPGSEIGGFDPLPMSPPQEMLPAPSKRGTRGGLSLGGSVAAGVVGGALGNDRPVVVVLPGIMGSHLSVGGNRIWLDIDDLAAGGLGHLAEGAEVEASGVLEGTYGKVAAFLSESHDVVIHPFDWRRPIEEEAEALLDRLRELLDAVQQPIRLLAHSMGGVLALASVLVEEKETGVKITDSGDDRTVWRRLRDRNGFRFLMLGTPSRGSHVIPAIFFGRERMVKYLSVLDRTRDRREVLDVVKEFQGLYDLLPRYGDDDLFRAGSWKDWADADRFDWPQPVADRLSRSKDFHDRLEDLDGRFAGWLGDGRLLYVAGRARETPIDVRIRDGFFRRKLVLECTDRGDGRVTWESGPPTESKIWYTDAKHGALPKHGKAFQGYLDLLEKGTTREKSLTRDAPVTRGAEARFEAASYELLRYPNEAALEAAAIGSDEEPPISDGVPPLRVRVTQGDLRFAAYPVAVGHYEDDGLFSAEAELDRQLDGALRRYHALGLYPGREESAEYFPDPSNPRNGALILGLDRVGELSPGRLERAWRHAVLRFVTRRRATDDDSELGLSAVMVGSGEGTGISIDDALRALIDGVRAANRGLRDVGQADQQVLHLEIIELLQSRAICAARALQRLGNDPVVVQGGGQRLEAARRLRWVDGGLRRTRCAHDDGWWRRVRIAVAESPEDQDPKDRPLVFTSLSDRARQEQQTLATQRRLVEDFVESSIGSAKWDPSSATTLFELLVPNQLKAYAPDQRDLVLMLDKHTASYPWELLEDGFEGRGVPISVRSGMVRQLVTSDYRQIVDHSVDDLALVIGDPESELQALAAAQQEAESVSDQLQLKGWQVKSLIRPEARHVLQSLFAEPYRILHVAAHGIYDDKDPRGSGIVIGGRDQTVSPAEIKQMRRVPELVFVNCCHLGRLTRLPDPLIRNRGRLAASVGTQLIEMGVRVVVVAGWVVDDRAAAIFAEIFYDRMLAGQTFGEAVKAAREATYAFDRSINTWGAYQCYGDPGYRLRKPQGGSESFHFSPVAPAEAVLELEGLASQARAGTDPKSLFVRLEKIEAVLRVDHESWMDNAEVRSALGESYGELAEFQALEAMKQPMSMLGGTATSDSFDKTTVLKGVFDKAIEHLEAAVASHRGEPDLRHRRHLARLQARKGIFTWRYPMSGPEEADERRGRADQRRTQAWRTIDGAVRELKFLENLHGSVWVLCQIGECWKLRAQVAKKPKSRLGFLEEAIGYFERAHDLAARHDLDASYYPTLSWCGTRLVHHLLENPGLLDKPDAPPIPGELADIPVLVDGTSLDEGRTFFQRAVPADVVLARMLWVAAASTSKDVASELESLVADALEEYSSILRRTGSPRQKRTKIEELDWIADLLDPSAAHPARSLLETEPGGGEPPADRRSLLRQTVLDLRRRLVSSLFGKG